MKLDQLQSRINLYAGKIIAVTVVFYILLFCLISVWKYQNFYYNGLDLAIFNQTFFNSAQGNWFDLTIHPPTYLGDHFSPFIILLLPLYLIAKNPITLLIMLSVISGLSAWPLYLIAKKALDKNWALLIALAWLLNPVVQNSNLFEFNLLSFSMFLLFWSFYAYQRKKILPFVIFCLLALLTREDTSLVIVMFGVLALIQKRSWRWVLMPVIIGTSYFVGAISITKLFAPGQNYKFFIYYPWINKIFSQPWLPLFYLFRPNNLIYLAGLGLTVVFLPLFRPLFLILGLLATAQILLGGGGGGELLLQTHYSNLLLPAVFIASVYGLKKIIDNQGGKIISLINAHQQLFAVIFITGVIYSAITLGPLVSVAQTINQTNDNRFEIKLLETIKNDQAVAASYDLLTPLSSRQNIYSFNYVFLGKQQFLINDYQLPGNTDWLALDFADLITYQIQYGFNDFYQAQYNLALKNWPDSLKDFGLVAINGTQALFQRNALNQYELVKIFDTPPELSQAPLVITPDLSFLGYQTNDEYYELFWQTALPQKKPYRLKAEIIKGDQTIYQKLYPFAYDLLFGNDQTNQTIQTNLWFNPDKKIPAGNYRLRLSLIEIIDGGIELDGIRSTKNIIDEEKSLGEIFTIDFIQQPDK